MSRSIIRAARRSIAVAALAAPLAASLAFPLRLDAQRVVVNHDEWTLSNTGYANAGAANAGAFAENLADWLTGGSGSILIWSGNFGLTQSDLASTLAAAGYAVTTGASVANWNARASFDAIFLAGDAVPSNADLIAYVEGGGGVLLEGGTGLSGDGTWNPFLNRFGLSYASSYNGIGGTLGTAAYAGQGPFGAALFGGVSQLYQNNGQTIGTVALPGDVTRQLFVDAQQNGLYAAAALDVTAVPEPATLALVAGGLLVLGGVARRRGASTR